MDKRLMSLAFAVSRENRVLPESGRIKTPKVVHYGASIGLPSGPSGTGTRFEMAGSDFK